MSAMESSGFPHWLDFTNATYRHWTDENLQDDILKLVDYFGHQGITTKEMRAFFSSSHHGHLSGGASLLHGANQIARLSEKRVGYKVYVGLDFIDSRDVEAQGNGAKYTKEDRAWIGGLLADLDYYLQVDDAGARFGTDKTIAERHQRLFFDWLKRTYADRPDTLR